MSVTITFYERVTVCISICVLQLDPAGTECIKMPIGYFLV